MKANYGPTGGEIKLRWQHGAFVADTGSEAVADVAAHAKAERVFPGAASGLCERRAQRLGLDGPWLRACAVRG